MSVTISGDGTITGVLVDKRIEVFTASGTWTVPAGVTYAIAHMLGGGGGMSNQSNDAGNGGTSSVAFASGTVSSLGGVRGACFVNDMTNAALANTGQGAFGQRSNEAGPGTAGSSTFVVAAAAVTPAASISVTVGAGGAAGSSGSAGGSGYVFIEYYV